MLSPYANQAYLAEESYYTNTVDGELEQDSVIREKLISLYSCNLARVVDQYSHFAT